MGVWVRVGVVREDKGLRGWEGPSMGKGTTGIENGGGWDGGSIYDVRGSAHEGEGFKKYPKFTS